MKEFIQKVWNKIKGLYEGLVGKTQKYVPVAIGVVEGVKKVMDGPVDDVVLSIIEAAIPGDADKALINKVKKVVEKWLPKILLELHMVNAVANITDRNEQLKAILAQLKLSSDETKAIVYHGLAALILEKLSDGKVSWSDATAIAEYYYVNFVDVEAKESL